MEKNQSSLPLSPSSTIMDSSDDNDSPPELKYNKDGRQDFKCRDLIPRNIWHKLFLLLTVLETAIVLALVLSIYSLAQQNGDSTDQYLAIITLVSTIW